MHDRGRFSVLIMHKTENRPLSCIFRGKKQDRMLKTFFIALPFDLGRRRLGLKEIFFGLTRENGSFVHAVPDKHFLLIILGAQGNNSHHYATEQE